MAPGTGLTATAGHRPAGRDAQITETRIAEEQDHLDVIYARLDRMRATTERRLAETLRESGGTPQARSERESYERLYSDNLTKYDAAEHSLYFGRLDMDDGEVRQVGRIGILDDDHLNTLLLDWRAPLARPFYLATPAAPEEVQRRRHIRTRNRRVRGVSDEYLHSGEISDDDLGSGNVVNESALVDALNAARTGHMTDIVETIQREQDEIIRSTHRGVTVVQGGPGTGKTAVALHRAAYLLYTYREVLSRSGVLIIGPNADFLNYIGQVLPSLGETGVLLSTVGEMFPGVSARGVESRAAQRVKGDARMVDVLKRAVRAQQSLPTSPVEVHFDQYPLTIDSELIKGARAKARSTRRAHNLAQPAFLRAALDGLAEAHARRIGASVIDGSQLLSAADLADIRDEMSSDPAIVAALSAFWPTMTPQGMLRRLYADPKLIRRSTPGWSEEDREALTRPSRPIADDADLSADDVPLLDELAELIGYRTDESDAVARARYRQRLSEAQDALDILTGSAPQDLEDELDPEILMAYDLIDAEQLAERQEHALRRTTAERAQDDRTWAFGHVIVDEAQELSAMAWRMVMRRIPNRWMTVIGDTAQTSHPAGTDSWDEVFTPYVARRWRLHKLTVNYRTPSAIMDYATRILHRFDPQAEAPTSLRDNGIEPFARQADDPVAAARRMVAEADWDGIAAIIVPDRLAGTEDRPTDDSVRVLSVTAAKGLEFDTVIVVEPGEIIEQSRRGDNDLYVALTRATQRLIVVHAEPLPDELAELPRA